MKRLRKPRATLITTGAVVSILFAGAVKFTAQEAEETGKAIAQGCVWKLSDGDNTIYLAGSVHLLRETDYPLPAVYDMAYADSARVVFEIDMADLTGLSGAMEMRRLGMLPEDESLTERLGQETFDRIVDYFDSRKESVSARQMKAPVIDRFTPGMIFLMISAIEAEHMGARPELGLETQYFKRAKRDDKPTGGLETIAYQMSRFNEFTDDEIQTLIAKTLDDLDKMREVIGDIIGSWHLGDEEKLNELLNEEMEEEARLRELLLTQRNKNWIPMIEEALEGTENVMFLVGAAHLIGENSVIDLLRKKGYQIDRVFTTPVERKKAA